MALCLARQSTGTEAKSGYLEIALDPIVNKTGQLLCHTSILHNTCFGTCMGSLGPCKAGPECMLCNMTNQLAEP